MNAKAKRERIKGKLTNQRLLIGGGIVVAGVLAFTVFKRFAR